MDLHRLLFREVRKRTMLNRLQRLATGGFLDPLKQARSEQHIIRLGERGRAWLRARGIEPQRAPRPTNLDHDLAVVQAWCVVAVSCAASSRARLISCTPDWERRRTQVAQAVIPDLCIRIATRREDEAWVPHTIFVEVDCGTEPHQVLAQKLDAYRAGLIDLEGTAGIEPVLVFVVHGVGTGRVQTIARLLSTHWPGRSFVLQDGAGFGRVIAALAPAPHADSPHGVGSLGEGTLVLPTDSRCAVAGPSERQNAMVQPEHLRR
jgi:hypothetical protein